MNAITAKPNINTIIPNNNVGENVGSLSNNGGTLGGAIQTTEAGKNSPIKFGEPSQTTPSEKAQGPEGAQKLSQEKIMEVLMLILQLLMMMLKGNGAGGGQEAAAGGPAGVGGPSGPGGAGGAAGPGGVAGAGGTGNPNAPGKGMGFDGNGKFQVGDSWGGWDGVSHGVKGSSHDVNDRASLVGQLGKMGLDDGAAHRVAQHLHSAAGANGLDAHKGQHSASDAAGIKAKNHENIKQAFEAVGSGPVTEAEMKKAIDNAYAS